MNTKFALLLAVLAFASVQSGLAGHAHSFAYFHGPVEGSVREMVIHDKHDHQHVNYIAYPKYEFAYGVEDHHTGDYHGQKEYKDGNKKLVGEYTVKEPGGNTRIVSYHVDPHGGFFAHIHNSGGNNHHGGTYGGYEHH
ncbi:cuticle protein 19-like [Pogonomyrmex barbatus]|uniref:Cuticle protein 19-like n=1 Tax=Pogonomyrmex barbatus TaxID=144034 RepID=A0A6I9WAE6_9HYME|nr:cuticle protein 19-like [Pogonomyrmex barbatus]